MKRIKIKASGWPWQYVHANWAAVVDKTHGQKWGWNPFSVKGAGRFGGGWAFKFGITASRNLQDIVFDLGIGQIRIQLQERTK